MTALTTVITRYGTRYEIDERFAANREVIVRRLAPTVGPDSLAEDWPDGTALLASSVDMVDRGGQARPCLLIRTERGDVLTSGIESLTDGVAGWQG